jgi:hypothetical protein
VTRRSVGEFILLHRAKTDQGYRLYGKKGGIVPGLCANNPSIKEGVEAARVYVIISFGFEISVEDAGGPRIEEKLLSLNRRYSRPR